MAVLENLNIGISGGTLLKSAGDLDRAVVPICMADKSANETHQNVGRAIGNDGNRTSFGAPEQGSAGEGNQQRDRENPGSGETRHAELLTHHEMTHRGEEMRPYFTAGAGSRPGKRFHQKP